MGCIRRVLTPRVFVLLTKLLVEECRCAFVTAVAYETSVISSNCPVRRLVVDEATLLQSRERSADSPFVGFDLRGDFACLEGALLVRSEESKDQIRSREASNSSSDAFSNVSRSMDIVEWSPPTVMNVRNETRQNTEGGDCRVNKRVEIVHPITELSVTRVEWILGNMSTDDVETTGTRTT